MYLYGISTYFGSLNLKIQQLPGFEKNFEKIKSFGIDEIYCCSVNDSYVMNAWADKMKIKNIKLIPDGSGLFTKFMGMLIAKDQNGFGDFRLDTPFMGTNYY